MILEATIKIFSTKVEIMSRTISPSRMAVNSRRGSILEKCHEYPRIPGLSSLLL